MKFTTKREALYGGFASKRRFHYVTYLNSTQIANGETKDKSEDNATNAILGALDCQTSTIYANVANDGAILVTRECAPNQVQSGFHRDSSGRSSGICMGSRTIDGNPCTLAEYHANALAAYNSSVSTEVA